MSSSPARWHKRGTVSVDTSGVPWAATHLAMPTIDLSHPAAPRLVVSVRDADGRSRIASSSLRFDGDSVSGVLGSTPLVDLGALGTFDDAGATTSCLVAQGARQFLYYTGWSLGVSVPFYLNAGLAISEDSGRSFTRVSQAPILDRNSVDPFLTASPWVMVEGGRWRMWYVSATGWSRHGSQVRHHYHVRYAESSDGIAWRRDGRVCLDFASPEEYAFGRPCVVRDTDGIYRMWYCVRGDAYRIGFAESRDGVSWTRMDDRTGIDVSADGFDSEMLAYPVVFDHDGRRLMFYNGNGYGRTGIGVAEWQ